MLNLPFLDISRYFDRKIENPPRLRFPPRLRRHWDHFFFPNIGGIWIIRFFKCESHCNSPTVTVTLSNRRLVFNVASYWCSRSQFHTFYDALALSLKHQQVPVITMQLISQLQSAVTSLSTATAVTLPNSNAGYALTALQVPSWQNMRISILSIINFVPCLIPISGFFVYGSGGRQISCSRFLERKRCNSIS
jgi:hypothetical protein